MSGSNHHGRLLKKQSKVFRPNVDKNLKRILRKVNLENTVKQDEKILNVKFLNKISLKAESHCLKSSKLRSLKSRMGMGNALGYKHLSENLNNCVR